MLSLAHATTGAFVASKFTHPLIYIPLAIGLHYVQDWIPHWDVGTGLSNGTRKKSTALKLEFVDLGLTALLIFFLWQSGESLFQWHIWIGAFFGLLPDFLEAPRNFLKWEPKFLKPLNNFHGKFHHSIPNMWVGLAPQVVVILAIAFLR
ncbi:MAG: hypothetical protein COU65_01535 [Candidatus Pacebacteria bacterium CG10_big_fil_rev_8_21_14_0_10_42_12]|nr:hypothetical protein [Candidatus Paceibacterota bacterium]PIR62795.1 MAG: hypothetical protein COU65_01535 [Candidatus Pacebacteria bacterium CG10_big_fil_rev_8_21_14_0_10_42_12]